MKHAVVYPTAEALDTIGYSRDWRIALYLIPAAEGSSDLPEVTIQSGVGAFGPMEERSNLWASIGDYGPGVDGRSVLAALREIQHHLIAASGRWEQEAARDALCRAWTALKYELVTAWDAVDWYATDEITWAQVCHAHDVDPERGAEAIGELAAAEADQAAGDGYLVSGIDEELRRMLAEHLEDEDLYCLNRGGGCTPDPPVTESDRPAKSAQKQP